MHFPIGCGGDLEFLGEDARKVEGVAISDGIGGFLDRQPGAGEKMAGLVETLPEDVLKGCDAQNPFEPAMKIIRGHSRCCSHF